MIKIKLSEDYSYNDVLELCVEGITGNAQLRKQVSDERANFLPFKDEYEKAAIKSQLFSIPSIDTSTTQNPNVIGPLKKNDLEKLYTQYFADKNKPARKVYDAIKNSAKESCPFCGGIGTPKNVDHFLPKAHFPQFSVLPFNLVPACRDCNMESKGHGYAIKEEEQIIHPYFEAAHFFNEQWIFANYSAGTGDDDPGFFEYCVVPPVTWSETDKKRVAKYFKDFDLATRYATQAAKHLKTVLAQINRNLNKNVPVEEVVEDLLEPVLDECEFVNHWQYAMYQGLIRFLTE